MWLYFRFPLSFPNRRLTADEGLAVGLAVSWSRWSRVGCSGSLFCSSCWCIAAPMKCRVPLVRVHSFCVEMSEIQVRPSNYFGAAF
ncbi:hypothetical protein B2J88_52015 [Rhodococcus sp. SRB_17]|nr:hypothetical protein [Rhodococcus sp. SRB_17]